MTLGSCFAHGQTRRAKDAREGLALIALTREGFVLAVDSASANADGTLSEATKMFPVGKHGAILFAGATSIQDPVDRPVRQQLNVVRIAKAWLDAHPEAEISAARREIEAAVSRGVTTFFAERESAADAGRYKFSIILAGFQDGKPVITRTSYHVPLKGEAPLITSSVEARPSGIRIFGEGRVASTLIHNVARGPLQAFAADTSLATLHRRSKEMSIPDYLRLFDVLLRASESPEAREAQHGIGPIAPPNHFAVLNEQKGFQAQ